MERRGEENRMRERDKEKDMERGKECSQIVTGIVRMFTSKMNDDG